MFVAQPTPAPQACSLRQAETSGAKRDRKALLLRYRCAVGVAFGPMATLLRLRDAVTLIELLILLVLALACLFWARSSKTFAQV